MNDLKRILTKMFLFLILLYGSDVHTHSQPPSHEIVSFTGATPSDSVINQMLDIPVEVRSDFIKWNLQLTFKTEKAFFRLDLLYGVAQPNTSGFIGGGTSKTIEGHFSVSKKRNGDHRVIYYLNSEQLSSAIMLGEINGNILHVLSPEKKLMVGNGGWSYTLNRNQPFAKDTIAHHFDSHQPMTHSETLSTQIYIGRTPCQDFAKAYGWEVSRDCFKLKWKLTLYGDAAIPETLAYKLQHTGKRDRAITGKWKIIKGIPSDPEVLIYQLDPDIPGKNLRFLVGDENVLFFLNKEDHHFAGNGDFSYTLNRSL